MSIINVGPCDDFQAAINVSHIGDMIFFSEGEYQIDKPLVMLPGRGYVGSGAIIAASENFSGSALTELSYGTLFERCIAWICRILHINRSWTYIYGLTFRGRGSDTAIRIRSK